VARAQAQGFPNAAVLSGGIAAWQDAGFPMAYDTLSPKSGG